MSEVKVKCTECRIKKFRNADKDQIKLGFLVSYCTVCRDDTIQNIIDSKREG